MVHDHKRISMAKKIKDDIVFAPRGIGDDNDGVVQKGVDLPPATKKKHKALGLSEDDLKAMYEQMYLQRRFEERAMQQYQKGKFGGFLHVYIGQEAISTGTVFAFDDKDDIITGYRDHGWGLCRGITANEGMAELFGKATGCSKGKGGSMHFAKSENHFWGGYGIVGGHIPIGAGLAFGNKYKGTGNISATFFGDGAVDQGALHETMNMAQLWKLPVIFVVENNGYSMGTAAKRHTVAEIVDRAKGYGMKSAVINGMDTFSVYEKMKEIADDIRENSEPWFVEIRTYRYRGHSMSDPQKYRTKEELELYQNIDPILKMKDYILTNKIADEEYFKEAEGRIDQEVLDSVTFADESPFPEIEEMYDDMFAEENPYFHV